MDAETIKILNDNAAAYVIGQARYNEAFISGIVLVEHPTNSNLKIGYVDGHQVVTGDHYHQLQLGIYIPEGAMVPEKLLREMWLWNEGTGKGRLGGKKGNRVKPRMFDGILSTGLFYGSQGESWNPNWKKGQNVAEELGITFTERPLPQLSPEEKQQLDRLFEELKDLRTEDFQEYFGPCE